MMTWLTLVLSTTLSVGAADAAASAPVGRWLHQAGDNQIVFDIQKNGTLRCTVTLADGASIELGADYSMSKTGILYGVVTKVKKDGTEEGPRVDDVFGFSFQLDKEELTITKLRGDVSFEARDLIEGEYRKAPAKKDKP